MNEWYPRKPQPPLRHPEGIGAIAWGAGALITAALIAAWVWLGPQYAGAGAAAVVVVIWAAGGKTV